MHILTMDLFFTLKTYFNFKDSNKYFFKVNAIFLSPSEDL